MTLRRFSALLLSAAFCLAVSSIAPASAQKAAGGAQFDGRWSVEVITDEGTCDRAYRWTIGIKGGRVAEMTEAVAEASGAIDRAGRVALRFARGSDVLDARGTLQAEAGAGTWRAPSMGCAGRWRAEKRG